GSVLLPCRWPTAIPDITVQLPLPRFLFPNNDVLPRVKCLASCTLEDVRPHLIGRIAMALHLGGFQLCRRDSHVHGALPECLDCRLARDDVAVGREKLPLLRIARRASSRIAPAESGHECFIRSHNTSTDFGCCRLSHDAFPPWCT